MRVPENWDRPQLECYGAARVPASYYPPLRFPDLFEKERPGTAARHNGVALVGALQLGFGGGRGVEEEGLRGHLRSPAAMNGMGFHHGTNGGAAGIAAELCGGSKVPMSSSCCYSSKVMSGGCMDYENCSGEARADPPHSEHVGVEPPSRGRPLRREEEERGRAGATASLGAPKVSAVGAAEPPAAAAGSGQGVEVTGNGTIPGPWHAWEDVDFPPRVRSPLLSAGFPAPTSIQQYSWPALAAGRDLIGIAKTGSGKTLSFLLPAFARLVAANDGRGEARGGGPPTVLVLAPTRELACQIEQESKVFGTPSGVRTTCLYGGAPKGPQLAELRSRPQVIVATPGRLNDLLDPPPGLTKGVDIDAVKYLVLDEADRMLDMGFEPQIRRILAGMPKQRQTVMFTATWPTAVRRLASEFLTDPVEVRIGECDSLRVNPDVSQHVMFCADTREKEDRLGSILRDSGSDQAIVFVNTKRMCEVVALRIDNSVAIHGDKDQRERDAALGLFKGGTRRVLVATDVAARGLDIKSVKLVVNFDPPNKDEDYVHRVGRTGRAGQKGVAISLLTPEDGSAARFIADILRRGDIPVPEELERRLASGELSVRSSSRGPRRAPSAGGTGGRRFGGGNDPFMDDDFGDFGGRPSSSSRFGGGAARGGGGDFANSCATDCPT